MITAHKSLHQFNVICLELNNNPECFDLKVFTNMYRL